MPLSSQSPDLVFQSSLLCCWFIHFHCLPKRIDLFCRHTKNICFNWLNKHKHPHLCGISLNPFLLYLPSCPAATLLLSPLRPPSFSLITHTFRHHISPSDRPLKSLSSSHTVSTQTDEEEATGNARARLSSTATGLSRPIRLERWDLFPPDTPSDGEKGFTTLLIALLCT